MYSEDGSFIADGGTVDTRGEPAIAQLTNGNVVVVWTSTGGDGSGRSVKAAILTPDGTPVKLEFQVNSLTAGDQVNPTVTSLPSGNFLIVWTSYAGSNANQIEAQVFSPDGDPVGSQFTVNTFDPGDQSEPIVAVLSDGRFVIAYESHENSSTANLRARLFDPSGTPLGSDFIVETGPPTSGGRILGYSFEKISTTDLSGGGFVISWEDHRQVITGEELPPGHAERDVKARVYGADGLPVGNEFLLSVGDATLTRRPSVVALSSGGFVAVWDARKDGQIHRIEARIFDAAGVPTGPEFQIAIGLELVRVTPLIQGGFLLTLLDTTPGQSAKYYLQEFAGTGAAVGPKLPIDWTPSLTDDSIVALADGRLLDASGGAHVVVHELAGPTEQSGGPGNDIFIVNNPGDIVHEAVGQGYDVVYTRHDYTLGAGQEIEGLVILDYAGTASINLTGNEFANYLLGNAGANQLNGAAGADAMEGRGGGDTYVVDNIGDQVIEYAGQGYDVVYTSVSYALNNAYEIEGLVALDSASTAALNLTGNSVANYLIGNDGANTLNGGAGADAMDGRGGNDTYVVDNAGDQVIEATGQGYDVIYTTVSYSLIGGGEIEGLVALDVNGTTPLFLTGNSADNYIIGNNGANQLNGFVGADAMEGRGGDDIYIVDNSADQVIEATGQGYDVVYTTASFTLTNSSEVEGLVALNPTFLNPLILIGNSLANYLIGNAGANVLNGGAGSDALYAGNGADNFVFSTTLGANNVDFLGDFNAADDTIQLDHSIFSGLGIGSLNPNAFVTGTQALDTDDRIIYDQAHGALYFDADGSGSGAAILFATLQGNPALTAGDFTVI